jgi:hypothetical protein
VPHHRDRANARKQPGLKLGKEKLGYGCLEDLDPPWQKASMLENQADAPAHLEPQNIHFGLHR